jgi:hypothetical protein
VIHAALALLAVSSAPSAADAPATLEVLSQPQAGGTHIRLQTAHGPVHLFTPGGYDRRTAGLVVYVHGLYIKVDDAWREHRLAEQFAASRRNALFIAPEAPAAGDEPPSWTSLRALIATALRRAHLKAPAGPLIVAGHSGAYRTLLPWLRVRSLRQIILVDALYGNEDDFRRWLEGDPGRRMTLVVKGTAHWADPFVRATTDAVTVPRIPARLAGLSRAARSARLLCLRSQYGHMELITDGQVLPLLLQSTTLHRLRGAHSSGGKKSRAARPERGIHGSESP